MSGLARTALRFAGIHALNQDPVIARLCVGRVYDSRLEPFDAQEPVPVIVVLTEEMEGEAWSANNGGPPFDARCDLVVEIAMTAKTVAPDPDAGDPDAKLELYAHVETAREMEAVLDMIEECAVDALTVGDSPASVLLRRAVVRRVRHIKSSRFVDAETGAKLAVRQVALTVDLKGDDQRDARAVGAATYPGAPWEVVGEFKNLPDPLRTVCEAMPAGSSAALVCTLLNEAMEREPMVLLNGVDATYAPQQELYPGGPRGHDTFGDAIDIP